MTDYLVMLPLHGGGRLKGLVIEDEDVRLPPLCAGAMRAGVDSLQTAHPQEWERQQMLHHLHAPSPRNVLKLTHGGAWLRHFHCRLKVVNTLTQEHGGLTTQCKKHAHSANGSPPYDVDS